MLLDADKQALTLAEEVIASAGFTYTDEQLREIPAILAAKNRYFWCIDHQLFDMMADVFTPEGFQSWWQGRKGCSSPEKQAEQNRRTCGEAMIPQHYGYNQIVQFLPDGTARLLTKMTDFHTYKDSCEEYKGWGFYVDDLVKCRDGRWRIKNLRLTYRRTEGALREQ